MPPFNSKIYSDYVISPECDVSLLNLTWNLKGSRILSSRSACAIQLLSILKCPCSSQIRLVFWLYGQRGVIRKFSASFLGHQPPHCKGADLTQAPAFPGAICLHVWQARASPWRWRWHLICRWHDSMAIKIITSLVVQASPFTGNEEVPRSIEKLIRIWPKVHECHYHVVKKELNRRALRTGCARHQCNMEMTVGLQYVILGAQDAF